jgi:hypothetical protein
MRTSFLAVFDKNNQIPPKMQSIFGGMLLK